MKLKIKIIFIINDFKIYLNKLYENKTFPFINNVGKVSFLTQNNKKNLLI